jgi:hypothetical protein
MNDQTNPPMASTRSDLRHLRDHSQATVAELKAFLHEMKGRSPQEMLGMVTGNPLIRATGQSVVILLVILAICTVIPYLTREEPAAPAKEPVAEVEEQPEGNDPEIVPNAPPVDPGTALKNLGVGEEKAAPADVNPLDTDTGSFLDELE